MYVVLFTSTITLRRWSSHSRSCSSSDFAGRQSGAIVVEYHTVVTVRSSTLPRSASSCSSPEHQVILPRTTSLLSSLSSSSTVTICSKYLQLRYPTSSNHTQLIGSLRHLGRGLWRSSHFGIIACPPHVPLTHHLWG